VVAKMERSPDIVCLLPNAVTGGGAERCVVELASALQRHPEDGYRPWVLLPRADGPLGAALAAAGVDHDVIAMPDGVACLGGRQPWRSLVSAAASLPGLS